MIFWYSSSSSSSSFNPVFPHVRRWPDAPHSFSNRSHSLSPSRAICSFLHPQSNLLYILLDLFLHVCFCRPRFRGPFTSNIIAFFKMLSSSLLTTCPCHLTPFALAILSKVSFRPSIFISSSVFFLSTSFTPHIDLTIALSVLLKITISFSLKHHVSLPCNIADLSNYDTPSLSFSKKTFSQVTTLRIL